MIRVTSVSAQSKNTWVVLLAILLLVVGLVALPLQGAIAQLSQNTEESQTEPSEIIIVYNDALSVVDGKVQSSDQSGESSADAVQAVSDLGITQQEETPCAVAEGTMTVAELPEGLSAQTATTALSEVDGIAYVQPNYEYQPLKSTSDPYCIESSAEAYNQYYLFDSGVTSAWDTETASGNVTVAVIDTGCELTHPDLMNNIDTEHAYDAVAGEVLSDGNDTSGHGTEVCGVIAGEANNGVGIAGASYNAKILPVKVFDSSGKCHTSDLVAGYTYLSSLVETGELTDLKVANVSLGYYSTDESEDQLLETAISQLKDQGVLTVAAGGNGGVSSTLYPSDFDDVLSVVGINQDGTVRSDADINDQKDIATYGTNITTTGLDGGYVKVSGTSFASPLVSGVAALVSLENPDMTVDEVAAKITDTSTAIEGESFGALDAERAVGSETPLPITGTFILASSSNQDLVLDAAGSSPSSGSNISTWTENGGANQAWTLDAVGDGTYLIRSFADSSLVLDAEGANPSSGANISAWTENGGANQHWILEAEGSGYLIRNAANSNLVLDAAGNPATSGANVSAWTENGGANQIWVPKSASDISAATVTATGMLRNVTGSSLQADISVTLQGKVLEEGTDYKVLYGESSSAPSAAGSYVVTIKGIGSYSGEYAVGTMRIVDSGIVDGESVCLRSAADSSLVLDAAGANPESGANVSAWIEHGGANQLWNLTLGDDGYYVIQSVANAELVLDAAGAVPSSGSNISVWIENGGLNQKWILDGDVSSGYVIHSAADSSLVLDAAGNPPSTGSNVSVWSENGGTNQKWI